MQTEQEFEIKKVVAAFVSKEATVIEVGLGGLNDGGKKLLDMTVREFVASSINKEVIDGFKEETGEDCYQVECKLILAKGEPIDLEEGTVELSVEDLALLMAANDGE